MVWDGDVVGGVALPTAPVVHDARQIGEVSVQVDVLSVVSPDVGRAVPVTLHRQQVKTEGKLWH